MRQAREKRRLAPARVMEALHREELPVHGIVGLVHNELIMGAAAIRVTQEEDEKQRID